jgi:hypothetical protein
VLRLLFLALPRIGATKAIQFAIVITKMRATLSSYRADLLSLIRRPTPELQLLKAHWPEAVRRLNNQHRKLRDEIRKQAADDPIFSPVDLLSTIEHALDERLHTKALAYLLDWRKRHGFGKHVLQNILERMPHGSGASKVSTLLRSKSSSVKVDSEFGHCDIWLEIAVRKRCALIIIENKIEAPEGPSQLERYAKKAKLWQKHHKGAILLIYLTPEGDSASSDKWTSLSYLQLAAALRKTWLEEPNAVGRHWLGLYITTIVHGVLGADPTKLDEIDLSDLATYLGNDQ